MLRTNARAAVEADSALSGTTVAAALGSSDRFETSEEREEEDRTERMAETEAANKGEEEEEVEVLTE